jgi:putative heme-binding domain-containing protein
MISGAGGRMGPELTAAGRTRSAEYIRESILNPSAAVPEKFAEYRLVIPMPDNFLVVKAVTRDGRTIEGVRLNEDPFTIQIRDFRDVLHSLAKSELKELVKKPGESMMPSFREKLTGAELDDLVAYLLTLRGGR